MVDLFLPGYFPHWLFPSLFSGKSTLLSAIGYREVPVPEHINIWHHHKESDPSDRTAMESVIDVVREEWERLEKESEKLLEEDPESQILADIYEKLDVSLLFTEP